MKKFRYICLLLLFVFGGALFSACGNEVFAKTIKLMSYQQGDPPIQIQTNQKFDQNIIMTPSNLTNREFVAEIIEADKQGLLTFEYDYKNMKISIIATDDLGEKTEESLSIRIKATKSKANFVVRIKIIAPGSTEDKSLKSPEVAIDSTGNLTWKAVDSANSYLVQLYEGETLLNSQSIKNALSYQINTAEYLGKSITAKVQAKAKSPDLDSKFSIIYFDVLSAPTNLTFDEETQRITWTAVENANGYNIKIGNRVLHTNQNYFDAMGYFDAVGQTNVSVMSSGSLDNRYLQSTYSSQIRVARMASVSDWTLVGDVLNWSAVSGATNYGINITNGEQDDIQIQVANNYIDLSTQNIGAGNHTIYVYSIGQNSDSVYSINSEAKQFNFQKLNKVSGLRLENGKIQWNSNASAYRITIDGELYRETRVASFDYSQLSSQTITDFNVCAIGDNATTISSDALFEDGLKIYKLNAPELSFDGNGVVSWNSVANASGYQIVLDNSVNISEDSTQTSASILSSSIDYSSPINFSFITKGDADGYIENAKVYLDSNAVYRTISKLGTINLQFSRINDEDCLMWSGVNSGGYKIFASDGENNFESEVVFQSYYAVSNFIPDENLEINKNYQVWAKTIASSTSQNDWHISSDDSQKLSITKLSNVGLAVQNGKVVWNYQNTDSIVGYKVVLKSGDQSIDVQNINSDINCYEFETEASGVYTFEIIALANTGKKCVSSSKSSITIAKLNEIENVKIKKITNTNYNSPNDKYIISFDDTNDGNANYVCVMNDTNVALTKDENKYLFEIYASQISQTMSIKISVVGDNEQFISCDLFQFSLSKNDEPIVVTNQQGTAIEANANKYFGLIKVDGEELGQEFSGTKNDEIEIETGKQFKIKSVAFDDEQTIQNNGNLKVDSLFSDFYNVSKLPSPRVYVDEGVLKVKSTGIEDSSSYYFNYEIKGNKISAEYRDFENLSTSIEENYGECAISGYFTDKNSGTLNDGIIYLRSDISNVLKVKKLPKPTSIYVRDGVVYVKFNESEEEIDNTLLYGGKLAIYVGETDQTENNNTQTSYEFARLIPDAGKYQVYAVAISQMSGYEELVTYSLHGEKSETIEITRLGQVENIEITSFVPKDDGTVANMVASIRAASGQLPNSLPYQSGVISFKAVEGATRYMIEKSTDSSVRFYVDKAPIDGFMYVDFQGTDFVDGQNSIKITAIGNQKEIIDGQTSDTFTFTKLKAPKNLSVENGKVVWEDENVPNNQSLENDLYEYKLFGVTLYSTNYPKWLFDSTQNAIVYYALINGKYYCTLDLNAMSSMDLRELCRMTNDLRDLSYDPNLETTVANVYTIQICATPFNSYVNSSMEEIASMYLDGTLDYMTLETAQTDDIYVCSDLSNSILVSPITSPYGLTMSNKILSWSTPYADPSSTESENLADSGFEVIGYQIHVYKDGIIQYFGDKDYTSISGATNTTWNFGQYLEDLVAQDNEYKIAGNYSFEVKTIVNQTGESPSIYYVNSAYSLSFTTKALETPTLGIMNGQIAWQIVGGSNGYSITIDDSVTYTTADNNDKFVIENEICRFVGNLSDGQHRVSVIATGGDEKKLISSPKSTEVTYTKLKKPTLYVDSSTGLVKFDRFDSEQYLLESNKWSYFIQIDGYNDVDLDHLTTFDISEKNNPYVGGKVYNIKVVAKNTIENLIVANEDSDSMIINSDVSEELLAYKISAPSKFEIVDNYQSVQWSNTDQNVSDLSYIVSIANNSIGTNHQTKYDFEGSGEVNAEVYVCAIYDGIVTIDGVDYHCLKSDANEYVNVHKLSAPTNIQMNKGILSWTRSLDAETHLVIKDVKDIADNDKDNPLYNYDFAEEEPGLYKVYLYNLVPEEYRDRTDLDIYLSSKNTVEYKIVKLDTPINFNINQIYKIAENDLECEYLFDFGDVNNAYYYVIEIKDGDQEICSLNVEKQVGVSSLRVALNKELIGADKVAELNSGNFDIFVKAIGNTVSVANMNQFDTNYASSNNNYLAVQRIAKTDDVQIQKEDILSGVGVFQPTFTGRLDWNLVENAQSYYMLVEFLGEEQATDFVFINNGELLYEVANKKIYKFASTETYCQFAHSGSYRVKVISVPEALDAQQVNDTYYQKVIQSLDCELTNNETLSYALFANGEGTQTNPYIVSNFEQFYCIRYNIYGYYKLDENIDYSNAGNSGRSFSSIEKFYGEIDGNDMKLTIPYAENFAGIVECLYEDARICNLTLTGTITSLKYNEENNEIVVGGFVSYNYGTVEKCLNKLTQISSIGSRVSTIGGIVAINYDNGVVKQCGNLASLTGNVVGGIVAKMFAGNISECYNGIDGTSLTINSKTANLQSNLGEIIADSNSYGLAGGIVAYQADGQIASCYSYADIYGDNSIGVVYIGGIVAYSTGDSVIKNCYAIDNYIRALDRRLLSALIYDDINRAKIGILIGHASQGITIQNCAVVYQDSNGTITNPTTQIIPLAIGENNLVGELTSDKITPVIKNGRTEYQYIYDAVSTNNDGVFVNNANNYCTLANAKYN